jgi:hypothetical protein
VRLFTIIAVFILVIACINFMNLSTAKAAERMKDAGIKKVMGASRVSLVAQYLGESLLMAAVATGVAVLLVVILLPRFNGITGKQLSLQVDSHMIAAALLITVLTGLVAGSYPALFLSGFQPAGTLKGRLKNSVSELWVRKGLVLLKRWGCRWKRGGPIPGLTAMKNQRSFLMNWRSKKWVSRTRSARSCIYGGRIGRSSEW